MKILLRLFGFLLFVVFFGFALKNTDEVVLHLFWNYEARSPLILMLLAFSVTGAALGVLAMTPTVLRYRRELARQKKALAQAEATAAARSGTEPAPGGVAEQIGL